MIESRRLFFAAVWSWLIHSRNQFCHGHAFLSEDMRHSVLGLCFCFLLHPFFLLSLSLLTHARHVCVCVCIRRRRCTAIMRGTRTGGSTSSERGTRTRASAPAATANSRWEPRFFYFRGTPACKPTRCPDGLTRELSLPQILLFI